MMTLYFIILLIFMAFCDAANILYAVPFTSKSHDTFLRPIGVELARRGHNVTVLTAFEVSDPPPNYHQIVIEKKELWEMLGIERPNVFTTIDMRATEFMDKILWDGGIAFTDYLLSTPQMQDFLGRDNKFDLIVSEVFLVEALYMLSHKYNAPLVLITAFGNFMKHNVIVGNPLQLATILYEFVPIEDPTSFLGRLNNLYISVYDYVTWRYSYLEKQEMLVKRYIPDLPQPVPSLYELQKNSSLLLINSHFSFDTPMAYLPNIIEIGGIHADWYNETLPKELEKILNESRNGVVYVNFGSNVRSSELPENKKRAFLNVFKRLKHTVLWKWEDDNMPDKPPNVIIRKWFPQRKILAHPNVKLFIGHGGLMSTQEAIYHGVPVAGMPIYADQYNNLLLVEQAGFGLILKYENIEETTLHNTINTILSNDVYLRKAKEVSRRFKDRPMSALDTAIFWIEYVIRNEGADYMKSPTVNMHWIVYNMLDVYAFLVFICIILVYISFKIVNALIKIAWCELRKGEHKKNV
ncbi:UDP-glycosyltransferase UGT5-like [Zerene cesonia]|uniref:UDP-glycosyltransferase UGT5-like n=1 Tax=Zerene cesonia TaxID=33412 RepID=UPI0018E581EE|nr:UDP-glycosyltransferase UGT5-like [Zerene cesonia]